MEETATTVVSQLLQTAEKVLAMETGDQLVAETGDQLSAETGQQCSTQTGHQPEDQAEQQTTAQTGQQFMLHFTETAHQPTAETGHLFTPMAAQQFITETEQHLTTETGQLFTTETGQKFITDPGHQLITETGHQFKEMPPEPSGHTSDADTHTLQTDQYCSQQTSEEPPTTLSIQPLQPLQPHAANGSCASSTALPSLDSLSLPVSVTDNNCVLKSSTTPLYDLAQSQLIEVNSSDVEAVVKCEVMDVEEGEMMLMQCEGTQQEQEGEGDRMLTSCEEGMERQSDQVMQGLVKHEVEESGSARIRTTDASKTSSSSSSRWSHADTLRLIQLYKENRHHFADKHYKKKTVWVMLAAKLARGNKSKMKFTSTQVYNRWKNLTKTYRDCLDDIRQAGAWVGKCRFFDDMASVYDANSVVYPKRKTPRKIRKRRGCRETATPKPPPTAGNLRPIAPKGLTPVTILPCSCSTHTHCGQFQGVGLEEGATGNGSGLEEVVRAVQKLHEDQKAVDAWKLDKLEQMHREKMNMFSQFLDILKTFKK